MPVYFLLGFLLLQDRYLKKGLPFLSGEGRGLFSFLHHSLALDGGPCGWGLPGGMPACSLISASNCKGSIRFLGP